MLVWILEVGVLRQISDPLIKVIPPYRHREQSSSCSSTTSGGGQQFSPHFTSAYNGNLSNPDGHINRRLTLNSSPLSTGLYGGNNQLNSVIPLSAASSQRTTSASTSVADGSGLRNGGAMLVDPIHRTPLPPTSVDRAMISAMISQPIVGQTMLDGTCSSPISSGRSSAIQDSSPPVPPSVSLAKSEQATNIDMHVQSVVPLPSNMNALINSNASKDDMKPLANESTINNGSIPALSVGQASISPVYTTVDGKTLTSAQRAVKRPRATQGGDKSKKPRNNNRANKSMKTLLESVGPLVSETVTDFQRERVNERDAAAAAAASTATHIEAPSTSGENAPSDLRSPKIIEDGYFDCLGPPRINSTEHPPSNSSACLPSTSTGITDGTKLCGVPLLRTLPKGLSSPDAPQTGFSVDRHHVSTSAPSTSLGLGGVGGIQHGPLPQTLEELLERQWEQGSHFMMAHAPFDVAQLLSCLHELKKENVRLEGELNGLVRRRDHLLAVNAQLSLGLVQGSAPSINSPINSPRINGAAPASQLSVSSVPLPVGTIPSSANVAALPLSTNPLQQMNRSTTPRVVGTSNTQSVSSPYGTQLDDSLSKLRNLTANSGPSGTVRNPPVGGGTQLPTANAPPVVNRPASRQTASTSSGQQTNLSSNLQQSCLPTYTQNRIPSTASANSIPHASTPSSVSGSSYTVTTPKPGLLSGNDIVTVSGSATTISPERQQQLAAAAVAAALGNPLNGNFLAPRAPNHLNAAGVAAAAANNPLGQFAPQELLAQYAILHHQIMQQQAAAAALRYSGIVMSGSSTPPTSCNSQTTSGHSGK